MDENAVALSIGKRQKRYAMGTKRHRAADASLNRRKQRGGSFADEKKRRTRGERKILEKIGSSMMGATLKTNRDMDNSNFWGKCIQ